MKKRITFLIALLTLTFGIVGCSQKSERTPVPTPDAGKGSVTGRVISSNTKRPYQDITIRLAEVYRNAEGDGSFALDTATSPLATTDSDGYFLFPNLQPGEYVVILGDPMTRYLIITDDNGKTKAWDVPENGTTDVGKLEVDFDGDSEPSGNPTP